MFSHSDNMFNCTNHPRMCKGMACKDNSSNFLWWTPGFKELKLLYGFDATHMLWGAPNKFGWCMQMLNGANMYRSSTQTKYIWYCGQSLLTFLSHTRFTKISLVNYYKSYVSVMYKHNTLLIIGWVLQNFEVSFKEWLVISY